MSLKSLFATMAVLVSTASAFALPADVAARADLELKNRCRIYHSADSVTLVSQSVRTIEIDQGVRDTVYTLEYRFSADSLPSRYVTLELLAADIANPSVDRFEVLNVSGHCY